jgi:hypothetical protein
MTEAYISEIRRKIDQMEFFSAFTQRATGPAIWAYIETGSNLGRHSWDRINAYYNTWLRNIRKPKVASDVLPLLVVVVAQKGDDKPKGETYGILKRPRNKADVQKLMAARDYKVASAARREEKKR